jgi:hypothetical protein
MVKKILRSYFPTLLLSYLLFYSIPSFAQVDPPLRIELESDKDQQDYKFISLENQGVAVFYKSTLLTADTAQWVFIHYDTNLVRTNLYKIKLPNQCQYLAADFSNNKLYLFLQKPAQKKDTLKNYLLEWEAPTPIFQLFDLQNYRSSYLSSIKVKDDYLFITVEEQRAKAIIYYNFKTHAKQVIQFADEEITNIESFCIDTVLKRTCFCLFLKNRQGSRAELFTTDYSGIIKERVVLPYYNDIIYNSVRLAIVGNDSLLLAGGYSNSKEKKSKGSYSGIYTLLYSKNKFSPKNTFTFGALLARDSALNMKLLAETNVMMNAHIAQFQGKVFAVTEVFYPEYQYITSSSYRTYGYYGYDPPMQTFLGFRFMNAFISEFNTQGQQLNEWFFPIKDMLTKSLYNVIDVYQDSEKNSLFYYIHKNSIISQFMNGKRVLSPQTAIPIELTNKTDILEYNSNVLMQYWYNNNFLLSGYQYIKNTQRGKGKRYVFFLNKMICE